MTKYTIFYEDQEPHPDSKESIVRIEIQPPIGGEQALNIVNRLSSQLYGNGFRGQLRALKPKVLRNDSDGTLVDISQAPRPWGPEGEQTGKRYYSPEFIAENLGTLMRGPSTTFETRPFPE